MRMSWYDARHRHDQNTRQFFFFRCISSNQAHINFTLFPFSFCLFFYFLTEMEAEYTPNDSNLDDSIEYLRISDYEPISSENPTQDNSVDLHNHNNADGFQPNDSVVQNADNSTTITYNGIEIHVFGNANGFTEAGLQMSNEDFSNDNMVDTEEEEEEERLREEAQIAVREAQRADAERRNAPLHPQTSSAIMNAMRDISLQGFRPDWADTIPEEQWIDQLRRRSRETPSLT